MAKSWANISLDLDSLFSDWDFTSIQSNATTTASPDRDDPDRDPDPGPSTLSQFQSQRQSTSNYQSTNTQTQQSKLYQAEEQRVKRNRAIVLNCSMFIISAWLFALTAMIISLLVKGPDYLPQTNERQEYPVERLREKLQLMKEKIVELEAADKEIDPQLKLTEKIKVNWERIGQISQQIGRLSALENTLKDRLERWKKIEDELDLKVDTRMMEIKEKIIKSKFEIGKTKSKIDLKLSQAVLFAVKAVKTPVGYNADSFHQALEAEDPTDRNTLLPVLIYEEVDVNVGNGYNPTTGNFTAPRAGYYQFDVTLAAVVGTFNNYRIRISLIVNGHKQILTFEVGLGETISWPVITHMRAGDYVFVVPHERPTWYASFNMFCGHLILPDEV